MSLLSCDGLVLCTVCTPSLAQWPAGDRSQLPSIFNIICLPLLFFWQFLYSSNWLFVKTTIHHNVNLKQWCARIKKHQISKGREEERPVPWLFSAIQLTFNLSLHTCPITFSWGQNHLIKRLENVWSCPFIVSMYLYYKCFLNVLEMWKSTEFSPLRQYYMSMQFQYICLQKSWKHELASGLSLNLSEVALVLSILLHYDPINTRHTAAGRLTLSLKCSVVEWSSLIY